MKKFRCATLYSLLALSLTLGACNDHSGNPNAGVANAAILDRPPYRTLTDSIAKAESNDGKDSATLASLHFRRAELLARNNQHEAAVPDYRRSWELNAQEMTGLRYAATLTIIGQPREAARLLNDAHHRFPDNSAFTNMLADLYQQAGLFTEALGIYDEMLKKDSADFEAWYEKGLILEKAKDTTAAIAALAKAHQLQPTSTYALELAHLYAETRNPKALTLADEVLGRDLMHEQVDPLFIKGIYYANTGQPRLAIVQFDSCIGRDWKFTDAYLEKGIVLFHQHKYPEALGIFQMTIKVSNTYPDGYYWIGRCHEAMGNKDQALIFYQRTLGLDKDFSEAAEGIKRLGS